MSSLSDRLNLSTHLKAVLLKLMVVSSLLFVVTTVLTIVDNLELNIRVILYTYYIWKTWKSGFQL